MVRISKNADFGQLETIPTNYSGDLVGVDSMESIHGAPIEEEGPHYGIDSKEEGSSKKKSYLARKDPDDYSIWERQAARVANRPCLYLWASLLISLGLSAIAMIVGDFTVTVNNAGWTSRGTVIANRHSQFILTYYDRLRLSRDEDGEFWDELINNVQPGWETGGERRRLEAVLEDEDYALQKQDRLDRHLPINMAAFQRKLQSVSNTSVISNCDLLWYGRDMIFGDHLWPIWKVNDVSEPNVLLNHDTFLDFCLSEEKTQKYLEENGLCFGCGENGCLPPFSLVFYVRLTIPDGLYSDCVKLAADWVTYNEQNPSLQESLFTCVDEAMADFDPLTDGADLPEPCPERFSVTLVDVDYGSASPLRYTSSIFATYRDSIEELYEKEANFDRGTQRIEGAFDTREEHFVELEVDSALSKDMALATGSAVITTIAMFVHTQSLFLTLIGFLQIIISFPLAYFVYTFIGGLTFFPFLNFIGIFVVFALGCDDVFVAVDKWKNARIQLGPDAETSEVAARAFPDAALAMFLTSLTTAIAFFGTAVCPVAPILCFAVFCGLLISLTYMLCVLLVFPALCIYDRSRYKSGCFDRFCCNCFRPPPEKINDTDEHPSLIHGILSKYYEAIHSTRYFMLAAVGATFVVCIIYAMKVQPPESGDVRLLRASNEFEKSASWREKILFESLLRSSGSSTFVVWGLVPADTGNHNDPTSFTQLVIDDSFEPSQPETQLYLRDFCGRLFSQEFADSEDEDCPIDRFDSWLRNQSALPVNETDPIYLDHCANADGLPMNEKNFHACIHNWSQEYSETFVLTRDGKLTIMYARFNGRIRFDTKFDITKNEWNLIEKWFQNERKNAPPGIGGMYFTSEDYWYFDTNASMISSAYISAATAVAVGAAVILFSSHSFVLTFFSGIAITYVLTSVVAAMVALGWTLGFIESICVSILIGISCDFVIHFTHAYSALPGEASRHARTKSSLIVMGPSILAAAFTTLAAAAIMLFTTITFFVKFAVVLFFTIVQATVASFVVFIVVADVCGPSRPTYLIDKLGQLFQGNADSKAQSSSASDVGDGADQLGTTEPPPSSEGSS
ncbi:hypothetical protein FisN_25Hh124 [Fistulifera solaris]|uniref:SSD domain-containing protein n=1 Tax=Fistulifera solaris TaxID=1519565 RepID=A0A1Z5JWD4_FISSO|nr:hypothetical protein FisN_25Hh124 [Fistulifera solaris]|eukprot:GAX18142.1 hypothetical protein FisN_25Hh124 [Fistulifera solaris]